MPEKFHQHRVRLIGWLNLEFEGNVICLSKDSRNSKDCLWVDVEGVADPGFRKGWAIVEGTFDGEWRGHFGMNSGALTKITRLEAWK